MDSSISGNSNPTTLDFWQESIVRLPLAAPSDEMFETASVNFVADGGFAETERNPPRLISPADSALSLGYKLRRGFRAYRNRCASRCFWLEQLLFAHMPADRLHQLANMPSARLQLFTTIQRDDVFTTGLRLQMADLIQVHDRRAVDAHKAIRAEHRFQSVERAPGQKRIGP